MVRRGCLCFRMSLSVYRHLSFSVVTISHSLLAICHCFVMINLNKFSGNNNNNNNISHHSWFAIIINCIWTLSLFKYAKFLMASIQWQQIWLKNNIDIIVLVILTFTSLLLLLVHAWNSDCPRTLHRKL